MGKIAEARVLLEEVLAADPSNTLATTNLRAARMAEKLVQVGWVCPCAIS
jgi:hypothetical protein